MITPEREPGSIREPPLPGVLERCSIRKVEGRAHISEEIKKAILRLHSSRCSPRPLYAQSVGEKTGVNSVLGIAPKTEDFIEEAAMSDMTEIEAAKIAQQKGNADEKKFAEMMLADHTKTSTELKSMVPDNLKAAIPAALDDASQKKIAKLTGRLRISPQSTTRCR